MPKMECRNTIIADMPASAGAHHAVLFARDCGATTRGSAQVSVMPRGEMPESEGNVFATDAAFGPELAPSLGQPLVVRWLDAQTLEIHYDERARPVMPGAPQGTVRVRYVAVGPAKSAT